MTIMQYSDLITQAISYAWWAIFLGLFAFVIVIISPLLKNYMDLDKLNSGEIRKAITIAFTIIYLMMLPCYFFYAYVPASVNASSVHSTTNAAALQTFNVSSDAVPLLATTDFMSNFLYIYVLIVSFYFGSRYFEDRRNANNQLEIIREMIRNNPTITDPALLNRYIQATMGTKK